MANDRPADSSTCRGDRGDFRSRLHKPVWYHGPPIAGNSMTSVRRIILDTDPGIDDALAILLAVASSEVDLAGVTVTGGNCSMEQGTRNALAILDAAKSDVPVLS